MPLLHLCLKSSLSSVLTRALQGGKRNHSCVPTGEACSFVLQCGIFQEACSFACSSS